MYYKQTNDPINHQQNIGKQKVPVVATVVTSVGVVSVPAVVVAAGKYTT